jgi:hypothetical protein
LADVLTTEGARGEDSSNSIEVLQQLLKQEDALLHQLSDSDVSCADSHSCRMLDFGISTIAPAVYPIQFFKDLLQQGPAQHAADITSQQFAGRVRQFVIQLSLHLHKLHSDGCAAEGLEALKDVLCR